MSFGSKYSKGTRFKINTEGFEFFDLKNLYEKYGEDQKYRLRGCYINNKSNYDPAPVLITDNFFVNAPAHLTMQIQEMLRDPEAIDDMNEGRAAFVIYQYVNEKFKRTCYGVNFIDF